MSEYSRRAMLRVAGAAAAVVVAGHSTQTARAAETRPATAAGRDAAPGGVVDTHTHFYDPTRPAGVPWPPKDDPVLYRAVLPAEYERLARPLGVVGTVVVEASPWVDDNQWLLDLAARHPFLLGVVGNLPIGDPEFGPLLARFAKDPLFRGVRVRDRAWQGRLGDRAFADDLGRLSDAGLSADVNAPPAALPDVGRLAGLAPDLRVILDHCGNVPVDGRPVPAEWRTAIRRLAERPNVWCKVSGLVEGTGRKGGRAPAGADFYRPVLDAVWDAFGPDRLVFGSNWPVHTRFADDRTVLAIVREYVAPMGPAALEKVFRRNGRDVYRWAGADKVKG